jgi:hypothetical protein
MASMYRPGDGGISVHGDIRHMHSLRLSQQEFVRLYRDKFGQLLAIINTKAKKVPLGGYHNLLLVHFALVPPTSAGLRFLKHCLPGLRPLSRSPFPFYVATSLCQIRRPLLQVFIHPPIASFGVRTFLPVAPPLLPPSFLRPRPHQRQCTLTFITAPYLHHAAKARGRETVGTASRAGTASAGSG